MNHGNIEIQKWQDEEYFCARIIIKLEDPYLVKERFVSTKNKSEFKREIERVLRFGFDSVLH